MVNQVPTLADLYQAERDVKDINTFTRSTDNTFVDGDGITKLTLKGLSDIALLNTGLFPVTGSFEDGGTITERNQYLQLTTTAGGDIAGAYTWGGTLPKTVDSGSTPSSTGGQSPQRWVYRGDATVYSRVMVREVRSAEEEAAAFASGALAIVRMDLLAPRSSLFMDFKAPFAFLDKSEFFHLMSTYGAVIDTSLTNQSPMGVGVADFTAGFLTTPDHPSLRLNSAGWGMECYFKLRTGNSSQFILSKGYNEVINTSWYFGLIWNGTNYNIAFTGKDNNPIVFQSYVHSADTTNYHHISINSDGSQVKVYVDGQYINNFTQTEISNNNSPLWIGGWNFDAAARSGYIAQLIVSNDGPLRNGPFIPPVI